MAKTVLLTRSFDDNNALKDVLKPLGYACIECSVLKYQDLPFNYKALDDYTNIIITSKHAASLLPIISTKKTFAWVVGEVSARILREKGYIISQVAQNAKALKAVLPTDSDNKTIYLSADITTTEMPVTIDRKILYNVIYSTSLPIGISMKLKKGVDFILLYSENCAKTLVKLLLENDLLKYLENTVAIGISSKVEQVAKPYFTHCVACKEPNEMIKILETYGSQY